MNTKLIMTTSALVLGATGIVLTFAPDEITRSLNIQVIPTSVLLVQIIGALYFGFAMLNWMAKGTLIGGIYNRPIAVANFSHFFIAGLAIIKSMISNDGMPKIMWPVGGVYMVLGLLFIVILFRHPIQDKE